MDAQSVPGNAANRVIAEEVVPLTFTAVDGLAFAAQKGRLGRGGSRKFSIGDIGPLLELWHLASDAAEPYALDSLLRKTNGRTAELFTALNKPEQRLWVCSSRQAGFLRTADSESDLTYSYNFGKAAEDAAITAGFPKRIASQLVAAIVEMTDNIYLHSDRSQTGMAAFLSRSGYSEFGVLDRGIGVLRSLQSCGEYAGLQDHGDALQVALTDGCSRFGTGSKHGHGFRSLFIGLSNLNGALRFRTGDHALTIDGRNPVAIPWTKVAKPKIGGFLAFVSCRTRAGLKD